MSMTELFTGKTIKSISYLEHEFIGIEFTDDSYLRIEQNSQAGNLHVNCLLGDERDVRVIQADNYDDAYN